MSPRFGCTIHLRSTPHAASRVVPVSAPKNRSPRRTSPRHSKCQVAPQRGLALWPTVSAVPCCKGRVTRLYVPTADAGVACRRCFGLSYRSQQQSYRTGGFLFELLGSWGKLPSHASLCGTGSRRWRLVLSASEPGRASLRFRHQFLDDLIDREARRLLSRWELFEALEPLVHDRLRGVLERDMLDKPVVISDAVLAGLEEIR